MRESLFCVLISCGLFYIFWAHAISGKATACSPSDLGALRSFAASFPGGDFSDWEASDDCCAWPSVTCDLLGRRDVTKLLLDTDTRSMSNYPIPTSICRLSSLTSLRLSGYMRNSALPPAPGLSGSIPHCIGANLTNLISLDLRLNSLTGSIPPSLFSLPSLQSLDLSSNSLSGPLPRSLPSSWQNLSRLRTLSLSGNSLIAPNPAAPKLPSWLFTLPSLNSLRLSSLRLQDADLDCSSWCGQLVPINLDFSNNNFSSHLLLCLSNYTTATLNISRNPLRLNLEKPDTVKLFPQFLSALYMSSCELSGRLTSQFFNHMRPNFMMSLHLAHNHLVGEVPAELGNLSLYDLDLSNNYFTGFAPFVQKFNTISDIYLSNNYLVGDLSSLLLNILNISYYNTSVWPHVVYIGILDVSNNSLTGIIPPFLGQSFPLHSARALKLNDNQLTGSIPNELFDKDRTFRLQTLSLSNNNLSGHIPPSFKNLKQLVLLDLSHNILTGNITLFSDASSGQYRFLRVLLLGYNGFTGSVPAALANIAPALQLIDFSNNHLTGFIPVHTLQSLPALTLLDFSGNNLSGQISTGLGELSGLVSLNLSKNRLSGPIPSDLGKLDEQLQSLDLSYNELVGPIPDSFRNLTKLRVFNVSQNPDLNGQIPLNQPQFENPDSYIGDTNLCGEPILHSCKEGHNASSAPLDEEGHLDNKSGGFRDWFDPWIKVPGLCLGCVVGFLVALYALVVLF